MNIDEVLKKIKAHKDKARVLDDQANHEDEQAEILLKQHFGVYKGKVITADRLVNTIVNIVKKVNKGGFGKLS